MGGEKPVNYLITKRMGNLLYFVAVVLVILWLLGFFVFHAGMLIHWLLVIAVIAVLLKIIRAASK